MVPRIVNLGTIYEWRALRFGSFTTGENKPVDLRMGEDGPCVLELFKILHISKEMLKSQFLSGPDL
jgi:hypothetical protein